MAFLPLLVLLALSGGVLGAVRDDLCKSPQCSWIKLKKEEFSARGELSQWDNGKAFCHEGVALYSPEGPTKLWTALRASINLSSPDGAIIGRGNSSERALSGDEAHTSVRNGTHSLNLSPFNVECVGLVPQPGDNVKYNVKYMVRIKRTVAYERLVLLCVGLTLFFAAPRMARSVTLFYGAGISIGIVASLLILLYMFGKFVPKKTSIVGLGILTGGYTLFASFLLWFWNHALEVVLSNWQYVAAYVVVASLISFAVLYRVAPPTNERTLNLIQWTVQLVGGACILFSVPLREVGVAFIVTTLLLYNCAGCFSIVLTPLYRVLECLLSPLLAPFSLFRSRPTLRFLTQQEYEEQGRVETKKAVEALKKHCRHRDEEIWDKISNLHDSKRFASFLAGKPHVSAQEQVDYEWYEGGIEDSTSESEQENNEEDTSPLNASHTSYRSSTTRSTLSHSLNSSSDSPTFVRERRNTPHISPRAHHFTSTPHSHSHH